MHLPRMVKAMSPLVQLELLRLIILCFLPVFPFMKTPHLYCGKVSLLSVQSLLSVHCVILLNYQDVVFCQS